MDYIPYGTQYIDDDDVNAVIAVLKSNFLTTGPKIEEFEHRLSSVVGSKFSVAVSSGTAALHLAALALDLQKDDEVILSPFTFAATANCILYCGGNPVFIDIDKDTLLMDIDDVRKRISKKTKAIIAVHYGGECCDMNSITELSEKYGIAVIQDAAHALGSKAYGKSLGQFDGMQIWSFHPVKTITTGEGGAVTTNDEDLYKKICLLRSHGITRNYDRFIYDDEGGWLYEQQALGYNYRITDIQCALGISQLNKFEKFAKRRAEIVEWYNESLSGLPLKMQKTPSWSDPVRHLYTIRVNDSEKRKKYYDLLQLKGIGVNVHYKPVYLQPYYCKLGFSPGLCPNAEDAYNRIITIPLYPAMTDTQVEYVVKAVKELFS